MTATPDTVQQLIELNEKKKFTLEEIAEGVLDLSYDEMDNLLYGLLQHQVNFHKLMIEQESEGPDREKLIANLSKLRTIRDLYGEI